jgi:hypothetical protein
MLAFGLLLAAPAAWADSTRARCEFRKDAEKQRGPSGPCTFSQRQGYVTLELDDGSEFELRPGAKPDHFHDEGGHKVTRKASGDVHEYKWEGGKRIIVTFRKPHDGGHGDTPHDLRDLVDGHLVGGEVDDELRARGYRHVKNDVSGRDVWSNWRHPKRETCISVHFDDGRVRSIVDAPEFDCQR